MSTEGLKKVLRRKWGKTTSQIYVCPVCHAEGTEYWAIPHRADCSAKGEKICELEHPLAIKTEQINELRRLHDAGIREAYRICGVEDDGEYRWKWVLLELSSKVEEIARLTEERRKDGIARDEIRKWYAWKRANHVTLDEADHELWESVKKGT